MLAALTSKEIAVSNLIQAIRTKASNGQVPNYAAGGAKSQGRTEPPLGAKVLMELYTKFGKKDKWLIELLWSDLADWSDWFLRERLLPPLGLVALGGGGMQNARYESGQDNSPLYDGEHYNQTLGLMEIYDVGFSSLVAQEAYSLASLALEIGRPREAAEFKARGDTFATLINRSLFNPDLGIFTNRLRNGTMSQRVGPTSFYPLMTQKPSNHQVDSMATEWLMSSKHFCIVDRSEECFWGMPSIQASDPAFPSLGYWRGLVWGPLNMLVFWSLENYEAQVPAVAQSKTAMAEQLSSMMMQQWREHRHICVRSQTART